MLFWRYSRGYYSGKLTVTKGKGEFRRKVTGLAPNVSAKKIEIYQPIRHKVFAHKSIQDDKAIVALFEKTLITDVQEILRSCIP